MRRQTSVIEVHTHQIKMQTLGTLDIYWQTVLFMAENRHLGVMADKHVQCVKQRMF